MDKHASCAGEVWKRTLSMYLRAYRIHETCLPRVKCKTILTLNLPRAAGKQSGAGTCCDLRIAKFDPWFVPHQNWHICRMSISASSEP